MSLDSIIRKGVAIADKVTRPLQCAVTHKAWIAQDVYGAAIYAGAASRLAIVEQKQQMRRTTTGELVMTTASVMFIYPVPPNGAAGRREPIDPRDVILLPDGSTGPLVDVAGFVDTKTTHPFFSEIALG